MIQSGSDDQCRYSCRFKNSLRDFLETIQEGKTLEYKHWLSGFCLFWMKCMDLMNDVIQWPMTGGRNLMLSWISVKNKTTDIHQSDIFEREIFVQDNTANGKIFLLTKFQLFNYSTNSQSWRWFKVFIVCLCHLKAGNNNKCCCSSYPCTFIQHKIWSTVSIF